jgi:hypothetical protein
MTHNNRIPIIILYNNAEACIPNCKAAQGGDIYNGDAWTNSRTRLVNRDVRLFEMG